MTKEKVSTKCQAMMKKAEELKKEMHEQVLALLPDIQTELFATYPKLEIISIRGYTPGFCDGDPCTYTHDVKLSYVYDDDGYEKKINTKLSVKEEREIRNVLDSLDEIYHTAYGDDGFEVIIIRDDTQPTLYTTETSSYDCGY